MLDHVLGRPSPLIKRTLLILSLIFTWFGLKSFHGKWKIILTTLAIQNALSNGFLLLGLNAPEPMARMYTRNFYRATYILTCLDAGFLTAMHIKPKLLRDVLSILFSLLYFFIPEKADAKVRKYSALATIETIRIQWEKTSNPILRFVTWFDRGKIKINRKVTIPRPKSQSVSSFPKEKLLDISANLYFEGTQEEFRDSSELIMHLPGGGFVTQSPEHHEDYVFEWARKTRVPIVSINYGKAPEHPYPWALEECYDAYKSIVESNGQVLGMRGWLDENNSERKHIKIILVGDSAGGNLACGLIFKTLESKQDVIYPPTGLMLIYPCLSFDMACWMSPNQVNLIKSQSRGSISVKSIVNLKQYMHPDAPLSLPEAPRKIDVFTDEVDTSKSWYHAFRSNLKYYESPTIRSSLAMTSRVTFFADRIINPELIRAMAFLYLGGSPVTPDFKSDYYLSPIVAPQELLARFPKTYLICGGKDPFVDDTVLFAGKLKDAKKNARKGWQRFRETRERRKSERIRTESIPKSKAERRQSQFFPIFDYSPSTENDPTWDDHDLECHIFRRDPEEMVKVKILQGMSHAFFMMRSLLPEAKQATDLTAEWFKNLLLEEDLEVKESHLTDSIVHEIEENHAHVKKFKLKI